MAVCPWLSTLSSLPVSFSLSQTFHFTVGDILFHSQYHFISAMYEISHWTEYSLPLLKLTRILACTQTSSMIQHCLASCRVFFQAGQHFWVWVLKKEHWFHLPWLPKLDLSLHYGYTPSRISCSLKFLNRLVDIGHLEIKKSTDIFWALPAWSQGHLRSTWSLCALG